MTWLGKPAELSPLVCARYGWQNTDQDLLQCVSCKVIVSGQLPMVWDDNKLYRNCCKKLENRIQTAHEKACKWLANPSPEAILVVDLYNKRDVVQQFLNRVEGLSKIGKYLPEMSVLTLSMQEADQNTLDCVVNEVKETVQEEDIEILQKAVILALCGWKIRTSNGENSVLTCDYCRRHAGVWNYGASNVMDCDSDGSSTYYWEDRRILYSDSSENHEQEKNNDAESEVPQLVENTFERSDSDLPNGDAQVPMDDTSNAESTKASETQVPRDTRDYNDKGNLDQVNKSSEDKNNASDEERNSTSDEDEKNASEEDENSPSDEGEKNASDEDKNSTSDEDRNSTSDKDEKNTCDEDENIASVVDEKNASDEDEKNTSDEDEKNTSDEDEKNTSDEDEKNSCAEDKKNTSDEDEDSSSDEDKNNATDEDSEEASSDDNISEGNQDQCDSEHKMDLQLELSDTDDQGRGMCSLKVKEPSEDLESTSGLENENCAITLKAADNMNVENNECSSVNKDNMNMESNHDENPDEHVNEKCEHKLMHVKDEMVERKLDSDKENSCKNSNDRIETISMNGDSVTNNGNEIRSVEECMENGNVDENIIVEESKQVKNIILSEDTSDNGADSLTKKPDEVHTNSDTTALQDIVTSGDSASTKLVKTSGDSTAEQDIHSNGDSTFIQEAPTKSDSISKQEAHVETNGDSTMKQEIEIHCDHTTIQEAETNGDSTSTEVKNPNSDSAVIQEEGMEVSEHVEQDDVKEDVARGVAKEKITQGSQNAETAGQSRTRKNDTVTAEPPRKRFKSIMKEAFDPLVEHRQWCPWINCYEHVISARTAQLTCSPVGTMDRSLNASNGHIDKDVSEADSMLDNSLDKSLSESEIPPWKRQMYIICPQLRGTGEREPSLLESYKQGSPSAMRAIRKIMKAWT
ncbi:hypothetical protein FSP39_010497 [Pinctada imbricata]|uniref:Nuclear-interacting partner of ALK n=1 Tax=Pinctada imbricata TaxID=66713 RepID=A0AA88YC82_PINIB|nr:hypothetical protein FSP39_010497 [Pinctada imbricata]